LTRLTIPALPEIAVSTQAKFRLATFMMYLGLAILGFAALFAAYGASLLSKSSYGQAVVVVAALMIGCLFILVTALPAAIYSFRISTRTSGIDTPSAFFARWMVVVAMAVLLLSFGQLW
jgi:hypothetical protein